MTPTEIFFTYTRYDIKQFLTDYADFVDRYYNDVVGYYSGNLSLHNSEAFVRLNYLVEQSEIINHHISLQGNSFDNGS
jgi:hypothetical protein